MILAIAFMYLCCAALLPFIAYAMYLCFDGDRLRAPGEHADIALVLPGYVATPALAARHEGPAAPATPLTAEPFAIRTA